MKRIKKLFKKFNNSGSSVVMVIVALAFIGILVGALLTAVGYSYRLKLQDMNSRDNFYYVEQAMNEIYAGVGSQTMADMQEAYIYTVENMVEYDFDTSGYVTKEKDEVQQLFRDRFIRNLQNNAFFSTTDTDALAAELEKFISNDSVKLDKTNLYFDTETDANGKIVKFVIKNVTLTRTQEYNKSQANGAYTQTISTDIEIGEPDFDVLFTGGESDVENIFSYALVADMGVEIKQPTVPVSIAGNVYAAADYYNKRYNDKMNSVANGIGVEEGISTKYTPATTYNYTAKDGTSKDISALYTHGSVTSKSYIPKAEGAQVESEFTTLYNSYLLNDAKLTGKRYYDGVNERSMYSGLYIDGTSVSLMSEYVIVPGTIAVMNEGNLGVYGKSGKNTTQAELWIDNLVLGGSSDKWYTTGTGDKKTVVDQNTANAEVNYKGSSAMIRGNLFVKDDTEINANGASLFINGSYYGYGDSTEKDERVFIPTVDGNLFSYYYNDTNEAGEVVQVSENRGHYNSSAIIINGQKSSLDLSMSNKIFLAGRAYIELSKTVTVTESANENTVYNEETDTWQQTDTDKKVDEVTETYAFLPEGDDLFSDDEDKVVSLRDYKTGESISTKNTQLAYIPIMFKGTPQQVKNTDETYESYWLAELHPDVNGVGFFGVFFPKDVFQGKVPCVVQDVSGKKYYYYDFETAYVMMKNSDEVNTVDFVTAYPSAEHFAAAFIEAYVAELNKDEDESVFVKNGKTCLTDITDFVDVEFEPGEIKLPNADSYIYSSGAITTKVGAEFNIVRSTNWNNSNIEALLTDSSMYNNINEEQVGLSELETTLSTNTGGVVSAYQLSNELELEYNLVKWNLGHYGADISVDGSKDKADYSYIVSLLANDNYGETAITPINKYINMSEITDNYDIHPKLDGDSTSSGANELNLGSGYSVWVKYDDVLVKPRTGDDGCVRGIIITKGDVKFDPSVTSFEGLIIAGGKIYVTENLTSITASEAICKQVLNECMLSTDANAKKVLKLFKGYEELGSGDAENPDNPSNPGSSTEAKTIENIDYSDVCRFSNWMKNVE